MALSAKEISIDEMTGIEDYGHFISEGRGPRPLSYMRRTRRNSGHSPVLLFWDIWCRHVEFNKADDKGDGLEFWHFCCTQACSFIQCCCWYLVLCRSGR